LTALFDFLSIIYVLRSIAVLVQVVRGWRGFWDADVTPADRRLANEAAFYVFIPLGVSARGRARVATWSVGGTVVGFACPGGYIVRRQLHAPRLVDLLSGNLVPLRWPAAAGAAARGARGIWADVSARQQLFYALVWYPVTLWPGDWRTSTISALRRSRRSSWSSPVLLVGCSA
jgi:hypothetical protein